MEKQKNSSGGPTLFFLHYLGGSGREWANVIVHLHGSFRCITIDLPGFGDAQQTPGYTVAEMASMVANVVKSEAPAKWLLAGHSMGAKIAAVLARHAEDGEKDLAGLMGLILIAGSPPGPEPMDESRREAMKGWFCGDAHSNLEQARQYINQNASNKLSAALNQHAVDDALRANHNAWLAWLDSGSREDWSPQVGVMQTPALLIAGADDSDLGPKAQRHLMMPHFAHVNLVVLPNAKHLLPLEYPVEIAQLIQNHVRSSLKNQLG